MKKLKGIVLVVILLLASIMMPFDVFASVQSTISPTFSSSTSQWNGHLWVTNFSDGTNNQASSTLQFTLDDDYYGMIYFDGYGPSNQHIANYAVCFIAGGQGEYRYSYYQNAVINITQVTIQSVSVVKPGSSVDLSQIVTLLTAIESDTTAIDNVLDSTLSEIRNVLAQLIISNGYLETISKLRQYNVNPASYGWLTYLFNNNFLVAENTKIYYLNYPVYNISANKQIFWTVNLGTNTSQKLWLFFATNRYFTQSSINTIFNLNNFNVEHVSFLDTYKPLFIYRVCLSGNYENSQNANYVLNTLIDLPSFIPFSAGVYTSNDINQIFPFDNELAIFLGVNNSELSYLNIIANGTTQSNSAASDLESGNDQMADDMNDLATIENGYNQQFNNQLQQIDFSSPLQNNAGILPAANFVITIFNGLINNNPFSVLIIVVCILLIGKKVIGK